MNINDAERLRRHLALLLDEFVAGRGERTPQTVLQAVVEVALRGVGVVSSASVTTKGTKAFTTVGSSDRTARAADHLQQEMRHGPAFEAIATHALCQLGDAAHDQRWPELGAKLAAENVFSALSVPLGQSSPDGIQVVAATLNLYADTVDAFSPASVLIASVLAAHAGPSWAVAVCEARVANLERALRTSMNIGPAIGVMMAHYGLGHDEARQLLREVSNRANRKVADLAAEIVKSVDLPAAAKKHLRPSTPHSRRGRR